MTGFTRNTDENNNISEYLSYSNTDGYTVLKSGWYYVRLYSILASAGTSADVRITCYLNNNAVGDILSWSCDTGHVDQNEDAFSIYLSEGDKLHFTGKAAGGTSSYRKIWAYVYPMF